MPNIDNYQMYTNILSSNMDKFSQCSFVLRKSLITSKNDGMNRWDE